MKKGIGDGRTYWAMEGDLLARRRAMKCEWEGVHRKREKRKGILKVSVKCADHSEKLAVGCS